MSRSCQSDDVLQRGDDRRAHDAGEAAQVLAEDGVALVGHRARALLPGGERLLRLGHLAPLPVPHVGRQPFDAGGEQRERAKYAACRSRATTCVATVSGSSPRRASACFSMSGERCAYVPTAPAILPTAISRLAASSRAFPRAISAWWPASARPNVTGSAKMPWLRPIIGVCACSRARRASASSSLSRAREEHVRCVAKQDRQRSIEDVARRHPAVQPARLDPGAAPRRA